MIIVSALSLSFRDKEREREKREIELDNFVFNQWPERTNNLLKESVKMSARARFVR